MAEATAETPATDWPPRPFKPVSVVSWDVETPQDVSYGPASPSTAHDEAGDNSDSTPLLSASPETSPRLRTKRYIIKRTVNLDVGSNKQDEEDIRGTTIKEDNTRLAKADLDCAGADGKNAEHDDKENEGNSNWNDHNTSSVDLKPLTIKVSLRRKPSVESHTDFAPSETSSCRRWTTRWRKADVKPQHIDWPDEHRNLSRSPNYNDHALSKPVIRGLASAGWLKNGVKTKRSQIFSKPRSGSSSDNSSHGESDEYDHSRDAIVRGLARAGWITRDQRNRWRRHRDSDLEARSSLYPRGVSSVS